MRPKPAPVEAAPKIAAAAPEAVVAKAAKANKKSAKKQRKKDERAARAEPVRKDKRAEKAKSKAKAKTKVEPKAKDKAKPKAKPAPAATPGPDVASTRLAHALAAATWAEADAALAEGWREAAVLQTTLEDLDAALRDKAGRKQIAALVEVAAGEAILVRQALDAVARLRGLRQFVAKGERERYDPLRHITTSPPRAGAWVVGVAPGVSRRSGERDEILVRAEVRRAKRGAAE